ncbi:hypothetical protein [Acinetobacter sp. TUM15064]|uniref:hypothetical protein n=1 Tax=Acinetobacter sp. TUM15064 TaxID=2609134 RepID=UPI00124F51F1|nr:hypothetical protein [Acinetobacter sp. TUM15064]
MLKKAPNKYFAPIIIAGITVGFFVSAYKFVFAKPKAEAKQSTASEMLPAQSSERVVTEKDDEK